MTDEPLNVQVARALNWTDIHWSLAQGCYGRHPSGTGVGGSDGKGYMQIPRYGHDSPDGWAVTGPLPSPYRIDLIAYADPVGWKARVHPNEPVVRADSAPEAIARLVVRLAEMGKLEKVKA